MGDQLYLVQ